MLAIQTGFTKQSFELRGCAYDASFRRMRPNSRATGNRHALDDPTGRRERLNDDGWCDAPSSKRPMREPSQCFYPTLLRLSGGNPAWLGEVADALWLTIEEDARGRLVSTTCQRGRTVTPPPLARGQEGPDDQIGVSKAIGHRGHRGLQRDQSPYHPDAPYGLWLP